MKPWAERFYAGEAWHSCRTAYLQSKNYLCERCLPNKYNIAKIAHHRQPLDERNIHDPAITLAFDNLEALCQDCHNAEHHKAESKRCYVFDNTGNVVLAHSPHS